MNILKCKMCGGDIEVNQDMTVGTCLFCGTTMTLPKIDSEKKARLFNRANQYRMNREYDKAYAAYEAIVEEDEQEAEAYWGLILSEYGVEYVEDPKTKKRVPTCNRTETKSLTSSVNYQHALKYAEAETRLMYQDEAEILTKIQKKILAVSSKEQPYDVFICYKETDEKNERTKDSVLAQTIYNELTKKGYRVFFARISLEDKIGQNYEPYIFAALNSAKVMLVVTTSEENCNAVWVKNEWNRYLHLMENDDSKSLIPVYQNMSPYELPEELEHLQCQDMGKIGALQDLVHGIDKLIDEGVNSSAGLLGRREKELLERLQEKEERQEQSKKLIKKLSKIAFIVVLSIAFAVGVKILYENWWIPYSTYNKANELKEEGKFIEAQNIFYELGQKGYKDSEIQSYECQYLEAISYMEKQLYTDAKDILLNLWDVNYKDSEEKYRECWYQLAVADYLKGEYSAAVYKFDFCNGYGDSKKYTLDAYYKLGKNAMKDKKYSTAKDYFRKAENYLDSQNMVLECERIIGR